jgi:hypothetical protein
MNKALLLRFSLFLTLAFALAACETNPSQPQAEQSPPKPALQYVDLPGFDRDITQSLSHPLPQVQVAFYDRITPSALPERLQKWMASIESGGGNVKIVPPPSNVSARSPFMLISAVSSIWSANKMIKEASIAAQYKAAHAYDAEVILKLDDKGDTVVEKIVFNQRKK